MLCCKAASDEPRACGPAPLPCHGPDGPRCNLNLELAERIELSTSPLPRECSATELRQPYENSHCKPTHPSYLERCRPSTTRKAKNPSRIHVSDRNFPGSIVSQDAKPISAMTPSAIAIRPLPPGLRSTPSPTNNRTKQPATQNKWCTGEDSNLRNSKSGRFTVCCH